MAKKSDSDPQFEDLDRLERFADLQKNEQVRKIVELERKLKLAETNKKELASKLKVTLTDLDIAEKTLQRFSDTQGQVSAKKIKLLVLAANHYLEENNLVVLQIRFFS